MSELVERVAGPAEDLRGLGDVLRLVGHEGVHERHEGAAERVVDAAVRAARNKMPSHAISIFDHETELEFVGRPFSQRV